MPSSWFFQRSQRPGKGWYVQAVEKVDSKAVRSLGLGYLDDDMQSWVRSNLAFWAGKLSSPRFNDDERKQMLLANPSYATEAEKVMEGAAAKRLVDEGQLAKLSLDDFVHQVWAQVRSTENNPSTWKREERGPWRAILPALGHVPMEKLDAPRWSAFLASKTEWSGRTKALAQTAYRCCLRYAVEMGVVKEEHAFRIIKGSNQPTLATPDNLTDDEVRKLLDAAGSPMHRALYAFAFGQGCRPAEVVTIRWENVAWADSQVRISGTKTRRSDRRVPLLQLSGEELHRWWVACGKPVEGPVFVWRGEPIGEWTKGYRAALKRAGLKAPGRRLVRYSARYTYSANRLLDGTPDSVAAETMGHSPGSRVNQRTYQKLRPEQVVKALGDRVWKPVMAEGS